MRNHKITVLFWLLVSLTWISEIRPHTNENAVRLQLRPRWNQTNWLIVATLTNQSNHRFHHQDAWRQPAWTMGILIGGRTNTLSPEYASKSSFSLLNPGTNETWTMEVPAGTTHIQLTVGLTEIPVHVELAHWIQQLGIRIPAWYPENKNQEQQITATTRLPSRQPPALP